MKKKQPKPTYDEEFKRNAVDLWIHSGKNASQIARELGISANSLSNWKKVYLTEGSPQTINLAEEVERQKKEIAELKQERDILKKSVAIFLKPQK